MTKESSLPLLPLERSGRALGVLVIAGALILGGWVWHLNMIHPRTNDAMIRVNTVDVAIQHVNGKIIELPVKDNQFVHAGDLLYAIDARPFEAAVAAANAALQLAEKEVKGQMADLKMAEAKVLESEQTIQSAAAEVKRAQAEETFAASYLARLKPLERQQFVSSKPSTITYPSVELVMLSAAIPNVLEDVDSVSASESSTVRCTPVDPTM